MKWSKLTSKVHLSLHRKSHGRFKHLLYLYCCLFYSLHLVRLDKAFDRRWEHSFNIASFKCVKRRLHLSLISLPSDLFCNNGAARLVTVVLAVCHIQMTNFSFISCFWPLISFFQPITCCAFFAYQHRSNYFDFLYVLNVSLDINACYPKER